MKLVVIIPALNEEAAVGVAVRELRKACPDAEILVIDDGSSDNTAREAEEAGARVIRHHYNLGYGAALKTGVHATDADVVVFFDGDGQHDPADVGRLLSEIASSDMVVGARTRKSHVPWTRRPGKWVLRKVANFISGWTIPDLNSGLRALRRDILLKYLHLLPNGFSLSTTVTFAFLKAGRRVEYIPIEAKQRVGKSSVRQVRHGMHTLLLMLRMIILFNPLRVFVPTAALFILTAIVAAIHNIVWGSGGIADVTVLMFVTGVMVFFFGLLVDQVSALRREKYE